MIVVGLLRWFLNMQREEIQLLFYARGTNISTGEISNLSEEFLLRFYALHKNHNEVMSSFFENNGGMILHLDGTGEAGDDIVFTAMDGRTGIKIDSQIMPSESIESIKPFLRNLKESIGEPIAIIRDMSKNIKDAASEIFLKTPHLICHYHFVSNLGKLIFKEDYELFRKNMVSTRILGQLLSLKGKLSKSISNQSILVQAECKWAAIAIEYLLMPREQPSGFPFVLPYYEIMNRMLEVRNLIIKIIDWNAENNMAVNSILDLHENVEKLVQCDEIKKEYMILGKIWSWFEAIRKILAVSRHLKYDGQKNELKTIADIRNDLQKLIEELKKESKGNDNKLKSVSKIMVSECRQHWEELTGEIRDKNGNDVNIVRHNGIIENNHRWSRMHTRRRTGRSRTTNDMAKYGALTAILSNLENEVYVKRVLTDVVDVVFEISRITQEEIKEARKLIKPFHNEFLISSDPKRFTLLKDFITILEQTEQKNKIDVRKWLNELECANPLMTQ